MDLYTFGHEMGLPGCGEAVQIIAEKCRGKRCSIPMLSVTATGA